MEFSWRVYYQKSAVYVRCRLWITDQLSKIKLTLEFTSSISKSRLLIYFPSYLFPLALACRIAFWFSFSSQLMCIFSGFLFPYWWDDSLNTTFRMRETAFETIKLLFMVRGRSFMRPWNHQRNREFHSGIVYPREHLQPYRDTFRCDRPVTPKTRFYFVFIVSM